MVCVLRVPGYVLYSRYVVESFPKACVPRLCTYSWLSALPGQLFLPGCACLMERRCRRARSTAKVLSTSLRALEQAFEEACCAILSASSYEVGGGWEMQVVGGHAPVE